jgi:hypothetical protein
MLSLLYVVLIAFSIAFFIAATKLRLQVCFLYCFGCLTIVSGLYFSDTYPDRRLKTIGLEIEPKLARVESNQEELKKIVGTMIKMNTVIEDGIGKFGDTRPQRDKLLNKYRTELQSYLPPELQQQLKADIDSLYVQ